MYTISKLPDNEPPDCNKYKVLSDKLNEIIERLNMIILLNFTEDSESE